MNTRILRATRLNVVFVRVVSFSLSLSAYIAYVVKYTAHFARTLKEVLAWWPVPACAGR